MEPRYADLRTDTDPATHAEYVATLTEKHGAGRTLESLPGILASPGVMSELAKAEWLIFDVPDNAPSLLLSDAPIVRTNGFHSTNGHMAMPLSPHRFLLIARSKSVARNIDSVPIRQLAKSMNRGVVDQARHFVVASDLRQQGFIAKHFLSQRKLPRIP